MEPEATKRIESIHKALAKLEATFHGRDLSFLRNREVSRRLACTKPTCKCNDENVIVGTMTSLLQENEKFLPLITEGAPVDEPWSEFPVPPKRPEQTYRADVNFELAFQFLDTICREFMHARHDRENFMQHNIFQCDCVRWLLNNFDMLRSPALFRFFKAFNMHNTYMIAIFSFCIENKLIDRRELGPMKFAVGAVSENWWRFVMNHVGKGYRRDRKRKRAPFLNFVPNNCLPALEKWNRLLERLRRDFPNFFYEDGKLNRDFVMRADPGPTSKCAECKDEFSSRYLVKCEAISSEHDDNADLLNKSHLNCRPCFKKYWMRISTMDSDTIDQVIAKTRKDNKVTFYFRCKEDNCHNSYEPETLRKFVLVPVRRLLFEQMLETILKNAFENAHLDEEPKTAVEETPNRV